jgi:hypothetical protein
MDKDVEFFFYVAAAICFIVAAFGETLKVGRRTRAGLTPLVVLVPLGLFLWLFPLLWNTGEVAL